LTNKKKQPFKIPTTNKQKRLLGLASLSLSISSAIYSISEEDNMGRDRPNPHFFPEKLRLWPNTSVLW